MTNKALPKPSTRLLESNLSQCQNLGLILDKYAPWQEDSKRKGQWDLIVLQEQTRQRQTSIQPVSGGQAKGLWINTERRSKQSETPSIFEFECTDVELVQRTQDRLLKMAESTHSTVFSMRSREQLVVGLGASHILETALTLDRNTGTPYIPGSTLKGLARSQALIEVASALGVTLEQLEDFSDELSKPLFSIKDERANNIKKNKYVPDDLSEEQAQLIEWFRFTFGYQGYTGEARFLDAIYGGNEAPVYKTDVMTPHFPKYYSGEQFPSDDQDPNPVTFLTVASRSTFIFAVMPRSLRGIEVNVAGVAGNWLIDGLAQRGIGAKTASGYGGFVKKSVKVLYRPGN